MIFLKINFIVQNISKKINFVGHNSKKKADAYLITIITATNCDHQMFALYPMQKSICEFSLRLGSHSQDVQLS